MADEVSKVAPALASWRTTASGTLALICTILVAVKMGLDGHLKDINVTEVLQACVALATAFGLMAARDNKVSSEQVGIK